MAAGMFDNWCEIKKRGRGNKQLFTLHEKPEGRQVIRDELVERVRSHYDKLKQIADDVERLGFPGASGILKERMPQTPRGRSGEIGEIIAAEFIEYYTEFRIPVRRLRYKDGREMALRGDDFLGLHEGEREQLVLLKGESKSGRSMSKAVVRDARERLAAEHGRPTPISLLFVADRLLESGDERERSLGRRMRDEVVNKTVRPRHITHGLFALSGNEMEAIVGADLAAADKGHSHISISFRVIDHKAFVMEIFEEASNLGDC